MLEMKILFRVDASLIIGTGHVMRCLTLAKALKAAGAQCSFACREHPGHLINKIKESGFSVSVLPTDENAHVRDQQECIVDSIYGNWLGTDWITDAQQTKAGAVGTAFDWLIVDHYALGSQWEKNVRPICHKLMVIDDLANRIHDCDVLLDQNLGRSISDYTNLVPIGCTVLTGPHYALIRPEFINMREASLLRRTDSPKLKHLLIAMGGVDQPDATGKVLELIKDYPLTADLRITVVMGAHSTWLDRIKLLANQMQPPTEVKVDVTNMAQLMAESDLAIGAAGITSWERCCLGLPAIIIVLAENQRAGAEALQKGGCVKLIDSISNAPNVMYSLLSEVCIPSVLIQLSKNSSQITDGKGLNRVKDVIGGLHE